MPTQHQSLRKRGLQASQHSSTHQQQPQTTRDPGGEQREGGSQPPTQSQPQGHPAYPKGHTRPDNLPNRQTQPTTAQKNTQTLKDEIQAALDAPEAPPTDSLCSLLQRALLTIIHQEQHHTTLQTVLQAVQTNHQNNKTQEAPKTWAQIIHQSQAATPTPPPTPRDSHVILVRITSHKEKEQMKEKTNQEILQDIKDPGAIAVKKLESGDIRVFTASKLTKERLSTDPGWIQTTYPSALVAEIHFQALVHGIRVDQVDPKDPASLQKLQEENGRLHPHLKIVQAAWLKSTKAREGKKHSSIILSMQSQVQARDIIQKGLIHRGTILIAEDFNPKQRATQCLRYGQFNHIAKYCRAAQACGKCSGDHRTDSCGETKKTCSNCKGDHPAWSLLCRVKQAAIAKARAFRAGCDNRPQLQQEVQETQDGWQIAGTKRKAQGEGNPKPTQSRKPPGKPPGSNATIIAGRAQSNKITTSLQAQSSQDHPIIIQTQQEPQEEEESPENMEDIQSSPHE